MDELDAVAFGCPAMGAEVLEESVFEPIFLACVPKLHDKKLHSSALTDGVMENGCVTGKTVVVTMEQILCAKVLYVLMSLMMLQKKHAVH